jgi:hypothetical protein
VLGLVRNTWKTNPKRRTKYDITKEFLVGVTILEINNAKILVEKPITNK